MKFIIILNMIILAVFNPNVESKSIKNDDTIYKRIEPVGKVCIKGECVIEMYKPNQKNDTKQYRSGEDIVNSKCKSCHSIGLLNAPKIGDKQEWGKRSTLHGGLDGLLANALSGINAMPAKGTCTDCTDNEIKAAIEYMSGL